MEIKNRDKITPDIEKKYYKVFSEQARYLGSDTYTISNLYNTDTRELFLMFVAQQEFGEDFRNENESMEEDIEFKT